MSDSKKSDKKTEKIEKPTPPQPRWIYEGFSKDKEKNNKE